MGKKRGSGEGSINQMPDGRWQGKIRLGPGIRRTVYGKTKQEVVDKLRVMPREAVALTNITVDDWLDRWLMIKKDTVQPSTWRRLEQVVRLLIKPTLGEESLTSLSAMSAQQWQGQLQEKGVSASERNRSLVVFGQSLNDAVKLDILSRNVCKAIRKPKVTRSEMCCLDRNQAIQLLKAAGGSRQEAFFDLALDTGMRPGELFALHWSEVDLETFSVFVKQSLEEIAGKVRLKEPKTSKGRRRILLGMRTVTSLRRHRERMCGEGQDVDRGVVFCTIKGGFFRQSNFRNRIWLPLLIEAGLKPMRVYDLRHSSATLLLSQNVNIKVVSERLGHETIELTLKHYAHALPSMQQRAALAVDALFTLDGPKNGPHEGKPK